VDRLALMDARLVRVFDSFAEINRKRFIALIFEVRLRIARTSASLEPTASWLFSSGDLPGPAQELLRREDAAEHGTDALPDPQLPAPRSKNPWLSVPAFST
jgi:hypothetical protein